MSVRGGYLTKIFSAEFSLDQRVMRRWRKHGRLKPMSIARILLPFVLAAIPAARAASVFASSSIYVRNDTALQTTNQNGDTDIEDLVGTNSGGFLRSIYQFDVSQIANDVNTIGGGDWSNLTINSVTLTLYERRSIAQSFTIGVYGYASNFAEASATWNDPDGNGIAFDQPGAGDTTAGGTLGNLLSSGLVNFTSTGADNDSVTFASSSAFTAALLNAAQGDGSLELILARTTSPGDTQTRVISFSSDEQGGARRPTLTFGYTVVPEPAPTLLGSLALLALLRRRSR